MIFFRLMLLFHCIGLSAQIVSFGVFGLFHPRTLTVRPAGGSSIIVRADGISKVLEGSQTAEFALGNTSNVTVSSPAFGAADILLAVPGEIERRYHGVIRITRAGVELLPVVEMDLEVAVASIVAAELAPGTPLEALKAQAVLARSFLTTSKGRHHGFQFCDTTHCQFIRAWPSTTSDAYRAAQETRGELLTFQGTPFAPLYSAACGGHTMASANEAGSHGYRYESVECDFCRRHPEEPVRGHRLGLCQLGASFMAKTGADYRQILNHYYPGTAVANFSPR